MRLFELICFCILILYLTGSTCLFSKKDDGARRLMLPYAAIFVLALSRFTAVPCPEFTVNAAVALTPPLFLLFAAGAGERLRGMTVVTILLSGAAIGAANAMLSWNDGMLIGLLCSLPALMIVKTPATALFTASVMPVFATLSGAYAELLRSAYTSCALGDGHVIDAMMTAVAMTAMVSTMYRRTMKYVRTDVG